MATKTQELAAIRNLATRLAEARQDYIRLQSLMGQERLNRFVEKVKLTHLIQTITSGSQIFHLLASVAEPVQPVGNEKV